MLKIDNVSKFGPVSHCISSSGKMLLLDRIPCLSDGKISPQICKSQKGINKHKDDMRTVIYGGAVKACKLYRVSFCTIKGVE